MKHANNELTQEFLLVLTDRKLGWGLQLIFPTYNHMPLRLSRMYDGNVSGLNVQIPPLYGGVLANNPSPLASIALQAIGKGSTGENIQ